MVHREQASHQAGRNEPYRTAPRSPRTPANRAGLQTVLLPPPVQAGYFELSWSAARPDIAGAAHLRAALQFRFLSVISHRAHSFSLHSWSRYRATRTRAMAALSTPGAISDDEFTMLSAEGDTYSTLPPATDRNTYALVNRAQDDLQIRRNYSDNLTASFSKAPLSRWQAMRHAVSGFLYPRSRAALADDNLLALSALRLSLNQDPANAWSRGSHSSEFRKQKKFAWCQFSSVETFASVRCSIPERPPTLFLVDYGRSWELDVFVFPHNALRAELIDLYDILEGIAHLGLNLQLLHIHRLSMWWQTFERFLNDYITYEDKVLLPWVYAEGDRVPAVHNFRIAMAGRRNRVNELALEVSNVFALFNCRPGGEILPLLFRTIREFLPRLLNYLSKEEKYLPRVLAGLHEKDEKPVMERNMMVFFQNTESPGLNMYLLTRWIASKDEVRRIKRRYLRRRTRFWYHRRAKRAFLEHASVVAEFRTLPRLA